MPSALRCSTVLCTYSSFGPACPTGARDDPGGRRLVEVAGILLVAAVDDTGYGHHVFAGFEPDRQHALQIDAGNELAVAQIGQNLLAQLDEARERQGQRTSRRGRARAPGLAFGACRDRRRTKRTASGGSHGAAPGTCPYAQTWPPHQRTVAKNPKIAHIAKPVSLCRDATHTTQTSAGSSNGRGLSHRTRRKSWGIDDGSRSQDAELRPAHPLARASSS